MIIISDKKKYSGKFQVIASSVIVHAYPAAAAAAAQAQLKRFTASLAPRSLLDPLFASPQALVPVSEKKGTPSIITEHRNMTELKKQAFLFQVVTVVGPPIKQLGTLGTLAFNNIQKNETENMQQQQHKGKFHFENLKENM
ncbi:hypothetical protein ACJX0J_005820, partial [Zea mays]